VACFGSDDGCVSLSIEASEALTSFSQSRAWRHCDRISLKVQQVGTNPVSAPPRSARALAGRPDVDRVAQIAAKSQKPIKRC
jgi:hypothetical protein